MEIKALAGGNQLAGLVSRWLFSAGFLVRTQRNGRRVFLQYQQS
jgi:hypothetical protein